MIWDAALQVEEEYPSFIETAFIGSLQLIRLNPRVQQKSSGPSGAKWLPWWPPHLVSFSLHLPPLKNLPVLGCPSHSHAILEQKWANKQITILPSSSSPQHTVRPEKWGCTIQMLCCMRKQLPIIGCWTSFLPSWITETSGCHIPQRMLALAHVQLDRHHPENVNIVKCIASFSFSHHWFCPLSNNHDNTKNNVLKRLGFCYNEWVPKHFHALFAFLLLWPPTHSGKLIQGPSST